MPLSFQPQFLLAVSFPTALPGICHAIFFLLFSHVMGEWGHFPGHWGHFSPAGYLEGPVFIPLCTTCGGHIPPG